MRLLHGSILALLLAGCATAPEPTRYVVVRGDTLGEIATAHGVTVDELRAWNALEGDLIEVDQVLLIHAGAPPGPPVAAPEAPARTTGTRRATEPSGTADELPLVLPPAKPCKPPPELSADGEGFATSASQGLEPGAVKSAINAFLPRTTSCMPEGWTGTATVQVDLRIGCDGRLIGAEVSSGGGLADDTLACITDRLRYAPFPAHALPDGERARVPLRYAYTAVDESDRNR